VVAAVFDRLLGASLALKERDNALVYGRARLMGVLGVLLDLLFAWIVCAQWIAVATLDPCPP
jgi:hypothetical protein